MVKRVTTSQSSRPKPMIQGQQGVALLTILLLVVAITVVAGSMVASQRISIRQFELLKTQDQLLQDIKAGEKLAAALIVADSKVNESDSLLDAWAQPIATMDYGQHTMTLQIQDAAGRFNLNNLYHHGQVDAVAVDVFKRLLMQLGLEPELAYAVLDWQDPDSETSVEGGAEKDAYSETGNISGNIGGNNGQVAGVVATISNQPFVTTEEVISVRGFDAEKFQLLQPYITAIPYYVPINMNTASPVLLNALVEDADSEALDDFYQQVKTAPAVNLEEALNQAPWSNMEQGVLDEIRPMLDVNSRAFNVLIDIGVRNHTSNSNPDSQSHRYATTIISKIKPNTINEKKSDTKAVTQTNSDNPQWQITAFGTRLLTYRPVL